MVKMSAQYTGSLHCEIEHGPSRTTIQTDAPKDNQGKGESFSPTDLLGAGLASCGLTTLAMVANRDGVSIDGATAEVEKHMTTSPPRRIQSLPLKVTLPSALKPDYRVKLEAVAHSCPVTKSLHPDIEIKIQFLYN